MIRMIQASCFAAGLMFAATIACVAQEVPDTDRQSFEAIITAQIEAFRADDGPRAYSFAAPIVRSKFRTADIFMSMVRKGYRPVYRPRSFKFGDVTRELGTPTQRVHLIGPDGGAWTALYAMQIQDDGSWKISAVALIREEGVGA